MTTAEEHLKAIQQFLADIYEKIRSNLLVERQKIIGFTTSEAATNLLEYFFHKKNIIPSGFRVNHRYFTSERKAQSYLDFEFPHKKEIISLMIKQEEFREILCYGKEKESEKVYAAITNLNKIKTMITEELGEEL